MSTHAPLLHVPHGGEPDLDATLQWLRDVAESLSDTSRDADEMTWAALHERGKAYGSPMLACKEPGLVAEFLRGAAAAAEVLATHVPTLPEALEGGVPSKLHYLRVFLLRLEAGCMAVHMLLSCQTLVAKAAPIEPLDDPSGTFRLAACAKFVMGHGASAAAAVQRLATECLPVEGQQQIAASLARRCGSLLRAAIQGQALLEVLGERRPAPALRAAVLKPQQLAPLLATCAVALGWCKDQCGPGCISLAAVEGVFTKLPIGEQRLVLRGTIEGRGLLPLVLAKLKGTALSLLRLPPSNGAELGQACGEVNTVLALLPPSTLPADAEPAMKEAAAAGAAALQCMLPALRGCGAHAARVLLIATQLSRLNLEVLQRSAAPLLWGGGPDAQAPPIPVIVLEVAAVSASAISAVLDSGTALDTSEVLPRLAQFVTDVQNLQFFVLNHADNGPHVGIQLAPEAMTPAAVAAEALLRLAGRLREEHTLGPLQRTEGAADNPTYGVLRLSGGLVATASSLIGAVPASLVAVRLKGRGSTVVGSSLRAMGRVVTTATKVLTAKLLPKVAANEVGLLMASWDLALEGCCQWSASGAVAQRVLLDERELEGIMLPMLSALAAILDTPCHTLYRPDERELTIQACNLWQFAVRLDALPQLTALQQEMPLIVSLLRTLWHRITVHHQINAYLSDNRDDFGFNVLDEAFSWVAKFYSSADGRGGRFCVLAVELGLLDEVVGTAHATAGAGKKGAAVGHALWTVLTRLGRQLQQQLGPGQAPPPAWQQWLRREAEVCRLPRKARTPLLSRAKFWEGEVMLRMLPAMRDLASAVPRPQQPSEQALRQRAVALATRTCANPCCTLLRGASEGRLRGRCCGGCGTARFCSQECQAAAWELHAAVCGQRFGEGFPQGQA